MAGQVRTLRRRLRSVSSTKKITKAQELIATSRLGRAQERVTASLRNRPPQDVVKKLVELELRRQLTAGGEDESSSYRPMIHWLNRAMDVPKVREHLQQETVQTMKMTPGEMTRFMQTEIDKWVPAVKAMNLAVQ